MQEFYLVNATENDSSFFYEVKKTVLQHYIEKIWGWNEEFQQQFHAENYHVNDTKIIKVDDKQVGTVEIIEDEKRIFICSLYLLPEYQNKKIGTTIVRRMIDKATKENKLIELEVLKLNVRAQALYKRLGFILTEKDDAKYLMYINFNK